jgi:outer membrane protein TolC
MLRSFTVPVVFFLECILLAWPSSALGGFDLFATERFVSPGPLVRNSDVCPKDMINKQLTLPDVVNLALCNNPQTHALWANSRIQASQLGSSLASYLPTLSGPISFSRTQSGGGLAPTESNQKSIGVSASYLLYDFGGRDANAENARQLLVAANATRDETLQTIYLSSVQSYYAMLSARASMQAYQTAELAAGKSLDAAQARYLAGTGTQVDRLQAQTALSQAVLNRIRAAGSASDAQGTLANAMGFDASQPFDLASVEEPSPDPVAEQGIGKLIEDARRNRPDLKAAEAQIKAAEAQLIVTQAAGRPTFTLNGGVSRTVSEFGGIGSTSWGKSIGMTINLPWFSGFRDTYQNRIAQTQIEGKVALRDQLANQIALDVWKAYQALLTNSQELRAANDMLVSAEQSEKMTLGRYKAGVGSILDVLSAQSTLASARQQRVAALYNFQANKFVLAQAIGQLDITLAATKN